MKITAYSFGKITIGGMTYSSDVIITPERVRDSWWRREGHRLAIKDLEEVVAAKPEVLVVGTGCYGRMRVPDKTRRWLEGRGIDVRAAPTGEAVKLFNRLQQDCGAVFAALHLTC